MDCNTNFPGEYAGFGREVLLLEDEAGKAVSLAGDLRLCRAGINEPKDAGTIFVYDYTRFKENENYLKKLVENGANLVFMELPSGKYEVFGSKIQVRDSGMLPLHFASRKTGHYLIEGFKADVFRLWYETGADYITPILETTFMADEFTPVLMSGNTDENGNWGPAMAAAEMKVGSGCMRVCQVKLAGRVKDNPVAYEFARRLLYAKE